MATLSSKFDRFKEQADADREKQFEVISKQEEVNRKQLEVNRKQLEVNSGLISRIEGVEKENRYGMQRMQSVILKIRSEQQNMAESLDRVETEAEEDRRKI